MVSSPESYITQQKGNIMMGTITRAKQVLLTGHFSRPGKAISQLCVYVRF